MISQLRKLYAPPSRKERGCIDTRMPIILDRLTKTNERKHAALSKQYKLEKDACYSQVLEPPSGCPLGIPTLERGIYRCASPMLKHRFDYAGSWKDAIYSNKLLSIREMESVWTDETVLKQIEVRKDNWDESPPACVRWSDISLFGLNAIECEEIYLVWTDADEPYVVEYTANDESRFKNVADCILFHCQV